ncbi:MAG: 2OG-Fe(II) oxygenase [Acidiferrobacterales bacterium]
MSITVKPEVADIARHFHRTLLDAARDERPYRHWNLTDALPESLCHAIVSLPIAPLQIDDCHGVRDTDNSKRSFFIPALQAGFPQCAAFAQAMQRPEVARLFASTCELDVDGSYLRMEYIQDTDGAWLKPHCDIPEKLFSMVIYLFTGPETAQWGTDIYDCQRRWIGQAQGVFNSGIIFIPGPDTWHGFEKRRIIGVRRLLEINYVRPNWRDRDQLSFPDRPITTASAK